MNRTALSLIFFGAIFLLFFTLIYRRSKRWVVPAGEAPDVTLARRRSNRFMVGFTAALVLGSWIGAAAIYLKGVDISGLSIQIILASIVATIWVGMTAVFTWKLREFSQKLELAGGNDAALSKTIEELRAVRSKFMFGFGMMTVASLLSLISSLMSAAR